MTVNEVALPPVDQEPAVVEHSMALCGLGPEGLLIALGAHSAGDSVGQLVTKVEMLRHRSSPDNRFHAIAEGIEKWKQASANPPRALLASATILDPRSFLSRLHADSTEPDTLGALLGSFWLMRAKVEAFTDDHSSTT